METTITELDIDSSSLTPITKDKPFLCSIENVKKNNKALSGTHIITIYGKDALGILSHIVGTISLLGIEIINAHTLHKTVEKDDVFYDIFLVDANNAYSDTWKERLHKNIIEQGQLIHNKKRNEANLLLTEQITESFTKTNTEVGHAPIVDINIKPVEHAIYKNAIEINVEGQDMPYLLYLLSAAFEKQDLMLHSFSVKTYDFHIKDNFLATPINKTQTNLAQLHMKLILTTQFAHYVRFSPNPLHAMLRFQELIGKIALTEDNNPAQILLENQTITKQFAQLLGSGDFLWEDFIRLHSQDSIKTLLMAPDNNKNNTLGIHPSKYEDHCKKIISEHSTNEEKIQKLNTFKDTQSYLIDVDVLLHYHQDFHKLGEKLSALTRVFIRHISFIAEQELKEKYGKPRTVAGLEAQWVLCALGKFGGSALGYASDIEIMLIYDDAGSTDGKQSIPNRDYFAKMVNQIKKYTYAKKDGIFCIDLRLRPHGVNGPLAVRLDNFVNYYNANGSSHSVERLALCRMRPVAGSPELAERILSLHENILYNDNSINWHDIFTLRKKQLETKVKPNSRNAKFSAGALVDVEYTVQLLQVKHGSKYQQLRQPSVRNAIMCLQEVGEISQEETKLLTNAYAFFRNLINALRMRRGNALDLTLPDKNTWELEHLARRMGYKSKDISSGRKLLLDFDSHTVQVSKFVQKILKEGNTNITLPEHESLNPALLVMSEEPKENFASLKIFKDKKNALSSIFICTQKENTDVTHAKICEHIQQSFSRVLLLAWSFLEQSSEADRILRDFARSVESIMHSEDNTSKKLQTLLTFYETLLKQPAKLDLLLEVFSGSRYLSEVIIQDPHLIEKICDTKSVQKKKLYEQYVHELLQDIKKDNTKGLETRQEYSMRIIREYKKIESLRIITRDICIDAPFINIVQEISALAQAILHISYVCTLCDEKILNFTHIDNEQSIQNIPIAILAFGKFGANELNYSSDLDLLCVYKEHSNYNEAQVCQIFQQILQYAGKYTQDGRPYRIDLRLRPHGNASSIAQRTQYMHEYYLQDARLWELQAAIKLDWVAGNTQLANTCIADIHEAIIHRLSSYDNKDICTEIHKLREVSVNTHNKNLHVEDDIDIQNYEVKNSWGGIRDIEFAIQALQLLHCKNYKNTQNNKIFIPNTLDAIQDIYKKQIIPKETKEMLDKNYIFLREIEHFLQVYEDQQLHVIPHNNKDFISHLAWLMIQERDEDSFLNQLQNIKEQVHKFYIQVLQQYK